MFWRATVSAMLIGGSALLARSAAVSSAKVGETGQGNDPAVEAVPAYDIRPPLWFPVGEQLTYRIKWGPISVGNTFIASDWEEDAGVQLVTIRVTTRSTPFFDKIYMVDDMLESVVDPSTFLPLRFTKRLSEGSHKIHQVTVFNHAAGTALWTDMLSGVEKELVIEPDTRCLLSFMFFMRSHKFEPDSVYHFRVMADDGIHDLDVTSKTLETMRLPYFGKVKSLLLEPEAPFHGLFVRIGGIRAWISNDKRCVLTHATAGFALGTIAVSLRKVEGPGDDFWSLSGGDIER